MAANAMKEFFVLSFKVPMSKDTPYPIFRIEKGEGGNFSSSVTIY